MMQDDIRTPKAKKTAKARKPSKPLDGINHRLLREQAAAQTQKAEEAEFDDVAETNFGNTEAAQPVPDDNAAPTRSELEAKAKQLGIKFDGRTGDKKLGQLIEAKLAESTGE